MNMSIRIIGLALYLIAFLPFTTEAAAVGGPSSATSADVNVAKDTVAKEVDVSAVYGYEASESEWTVEEIKRRLRPETRRQASRVVFDLPDAFYYIATPIFLLFFIRVYVTLLDDIEEMRIEELRETYRMNHGTQ